MAWTFCVTCCKQPSERDQARFTLDLARLLLVRSRFLRSGPVLIDSYPIEKLMNVPSLSHNVVIGIE